MKVVGFGMVRLGVTGEGRGADELLGMSIGSHKGELG